MDGEKGHSPIATPDEIHRIKVIRAWVKAHPDDVFSKALLAKHSLHRFLAPLANIRSDIGFSIREVTSLVRSRSQPAGRGEGETTLEDFSHLTPTVFTFLPKVLLWGCLSFNLSRLCSRR